MVFLTGLPLPPSSNEIYTNLSIQGRPGRVKSKSYVEYLKAVDDWAWAHMSELRPARAWIQSLYPTDVIRVDCLFIQERKSILCHNGTPKRNDTMNRLKAPFDALARLLHVEDSRFWSGSFDKVPGTPEGMVLRMSLGKILPHDEAVREFSGV